MDAVSVSQLSHRYGDTLALDAVSLQIPYGHTVALIGPDGVGKSTLLSLIAGVKILQTGQVQVLDKDVTDKKQRKELAHLIAFMPQGLGKNLYPTLSIYENVDFHARLYGLEKAYREQRIDRLLTATGLLPFKERPAGKLSGGMKQKLSLCCALIHSPELLILDEPTTGVDPLSRRQFWRLVDDLRQESPGMTVIVSTAYIDEAEHFEYLIAMDDGHIIANDLTRNIIEQSGCKTLEEAYIRLLPKDKQGAVDGLQIPPFVPIPNAPSAISAEGLSKKFGDFVAVDHVSFDIPKGEIFGFLGSNGCGKSTTMKMLTGLLDSSEGSATLLGSPINASDISTRKRVGYMSQAFSLYEELTVYQNLELHAKLYQITDKKQRIEAIMQQFELSNLAHQTPASLPLGIRQRLQLAAACLHKPEVLILDEPTSGVDPAARDTFWQYLIRLSREDHITIFVSTHFMNEAQRCDRISFMHAGRVLAIGTPEELRIAQQTSTLEDAFIRYLEQAGDMQPETSDNVSTHTKAVVNNMKAPVQPSTETNNTNNNTKTLSRHQQSRSTSFSAWFALMWAFAVREAKELWRDRIRLFFAVGGPLLMLLTMASSISFDVKPTRFVVLDRDNSSESRALIEHFHGSHYFIDQGNIYSSLEATDLLQEGEIKLVIEIPEHYGAKLLRQEKPEVAFLIDGSYPSLAENLGASVQGIILEYMQDILKRYNISISSESPIETRFVYNQDFRSVYAITPGIIMLAMMLVPAMMTALGVVREKELGSIMNLYGAPASTLQFLLGKQLPYIMLSFVSYLILVWFAIVLFGVPLKGSFLALSIGALLVICASTGFGLLMSSFVQSQIAAIFATAILSMLPTINFAGLIYPTSALDSYLYYIGHGFPGTWFQLISLGAFTKGLGVKDFFLNYAMLAMFYGVFLGFATILLKKQEK
ncbi:ribosome-associated ATPase/putative transporter RbbA [Pelistega europaea]|uniref:Ribosome-associated ATPase/putative transporter RbbA n=1 Tax=Pelistega europaea TaxID=106147 RepID=A0A7Y4LA95_9BURK|nr:ribosome-associated ATPase/putative transporter RbbA [Pelistega europaea]NOL49817.1 ribosome-associated ATPase/putative transporter RbbA [Pelistega europaea]